MQAEQLHVIDANIFKGKRKIVFFVCVIVLLAGLFFTRGKLYVIYLSLKASSATNAGNFEKAEALYQEIITLDPKAAEPYWQLGVVYISTNNELGVSRQIVKLKQMGRSDLAVSLRKLFQAKEVRY
ncbi:MAG: hypothetical protein PHY73_00950 [Candidatus Omnitrophica bacterium]|nr:hypothetical protein [Candidatus Omnitrophota bacterium]